MSSLILPRRSILKGIAASLIAAPAIARATSLMPVKVMKPLPACAWQEGTHIQFTSRYPGTIPSSVTLNGLPLFRVDGTEVVGGDLVAGKTYAIRLFDSESRWRLYG